MRESDGNWLRGLKREFCTVSVEDQLDRQMHGQTHTQYKISNPCEKASAHTNRHTHGLKFNKPTNRSPIISHSKAHMQADNTLTKHSR